MTGGSPGLRNGAGLLKHGVHKALSKVLGTAVVALPDLALTQDLPRAKVVLCLESEKKTSKKKGELSKLTKNSWTC